MEIDENKFPELKRLVNEVKSGQRVLLFPPGVFIFAITMVVLLIASVLCFAVTLANVYSGSEASAVATAQLISMPLILAAIVIPGIFAIRGRISSIYWFKSYSLGICIIAAFGFLWSVIYLSNSQAVPFAMALALGGFTFISTRSTSFSLLIHYHYFLRNS